MGYEADFSVHQRGSSLPNHTARTSEAKCFGAAWEQGVLMPGLTNVGHTASWASSTSATNAPRL